MVAMPTVASEVALIEAFADTKVIGITLNHEQMDDAEITATIQELEHALGIPVTDPLTRPLERLVDMVLLAFPALRAALTPGGRCAPRAWRSTSTRSLTPRAASLTGRLPAAPGGRTRRQLGKRWAVRVG